MVTVDWVRALARYNRWMNDRIFEVAASLSDEARRRDLGAFFGSVHGTLNHILLADRIWLARLNGVAIPDGQMGPGGIRSLDQELFADFEELRGERRRTDEDLSAWVHELTAERLAAPVEFVRRGQPQRLPLWWAVAHVFNHQTHHRGQATTLLTQLEREPGVTDLFAMLHAETAPPAP